MSERSDFQAGDEARRAVLHDAGHEPGGTGDRMEGLLRYPKGAGLGADAGIGRTKPLCDADIHTLTVRLATDAGVEVSAAIVAAGSVWLRGRIGLRSGIAPLEKQLSRIPGVTRLDLNLTCDTDDL